MIVCICFKCVHFTYILHRLGRKKKIVLAMYGCHHSECWFEKFYNRCVVLHSTQSTIVDAEESHVSEHCREWEFVLLDRSTLRRSLAMDDRRRCIRLFPTCLHRHVRRDQSVVERRNIHYVEPSACPFGTIQAMRRAQLLFMR